jgi:hypothetical protein
MDNLFSSTGTLTYGPGIRIALNADQGIVDYYRNLLPKWIRTNPQKHQAHVSVVRWETPLYTDVWGIYEGERIKFFYDVEVKNDTTYYWLNVQCERLKEIRVELGLAPYPWWRNSYHLTIGNCKGFDDGDE